MLLCSAGDDPYEVAIGGIELPPSVPRPVVTFVPLLEFDIVPHDIISEVCATAWGVALSASGEWGVPIKAVCVGFLLGDGRTQPLSQPGVVGVACTSPRSCEALARWVLHSPAERLAVLARIPVFVVGGCERRVCFLGMVCQPLPLPSPSPLPPFP